MAQTFELEEIGRLPQPDDNVAIATRRLEAGTQIDHQRSSFTLAHTLLEGHRFAVKPIAPGESLLSWGLPFGVASRPLSPGTYACNPQILEALGLRHLDFELPAEANFEDQIQPYVLDESTFQPGHQVPALSTPATFLGFKRSTSRGVGTRNVIVILGTSSRTGSFAKRLEERLAGEAEQYENIDGIVAIAHTEGGEQAQPNNLDLLLRTLAGFVTHPNVGAILCVDYGIEAVTNAMLKAYLENESYPLDDVPHAFLTLDGGFEFQLEKGESLLRSWFETVNQTARTEEPLSHLKIALQCGGSDAFSGISGNPLVAWVAREIIRNGGAANLAETDELIGAESYVLQNVKNVDIARQFLAKVEAFKTLAAWHGHTAEGNPSGGNKYRGLYNIVLKSIGAAQKKHPDVCLDGVLDYGEPIPESGYYFMDSPGNDLESIAGQVATGCNIIFFVTGNGSITNFPFVPTIKVITTTERHHLLSKDMDINAGAYLDGSPMDQLGQEMFDDTLSVASGKLSFGERAGHAQVSIWRNWRQTDPSQVEPILSQPALKNAPIPIQSDGQKSSRTFTSIQTPRGNVTDQIGLILPTSLCSGQIAQMAAQRLTEKGLGQTQGISRFVGLVHTEGCGVSGGYNETLYTRTMLGYLTHPTVKYALLLEHGCEKTHNDYYRHALEEQGLSSDDYGWASVQMDGGIDQVLEKIESWFITRLNQASAPVYKTTGLNDLRVGLLTAGPVSAAATSTLTQLTQKIVGSGGTLIVPESATLVRETDYLKTLVNQKNVQPTLPHGEAACQPGFYVMENPTEHWVETLTGMGGTGVEILLAYTGQHPQQGHPLMPMLQITGEHNIAAHFGDDFDLTFSENVGENVERVVDLLTQVASREYTPKAVLQGNTDFQFTRGLLGVSM
ncbi:MAG: UxaA family hydrolase [bacterium]|nr:UxaA family hydrolase [bacterium]